jgi:hypothetical protein
MLDVERAWVDDRGGAAAGCQPELANAGDRRDLVAPGAGRVDDDRCMEHDAGGGVHVPAARPALDPAGPAAQREGAAGSAQLAQEPLLDRRHVQVEGVPLDRRGDGVARPQGRHHRAHRRDRDRLEADAFGQHLLELRPLRLRRQIQHRSVADQRMFGEARRRHLEEGARQAGQHAHIGWAVILHPHRRRPAGGVVAGRVLRLHQRDALVRREVRRGGGAGHAGADDDKVEILGCHALHHRGCGGRRQAFRGDFSPSP